MKKCWIYLWLLLPAANFADPVLQWLGLEEVVGRSKSYIEWTYQIQWKYYGRLSNGYDVFWAGGMDEATYILHEKNGNLTIACKLPEIKVHSIDPPKNQIVVSRRVDRSSVDNFFEAVVSTYPSLLPYYTRSFKDWMKLEHRFLGFYQSLTEIDDAGQLKIIQPVLAFVKTCDRWEPASWNLNEIDFDNDDRQDKYRSPTHLAIKDTYKGDDIKECALRLLQTIDKDMPDELKEGGVAHSPVCFQKLFEDDLRFGQLSTVSISLSENKDLPYQRLNAEHFSCRYIGRIGEVFLFEAQYPRYDGSRYVDKSFGLYTVVKQGDQLTKVARLAHKFGHFGFEGGGYEIDENALIYYADVQLSEVLPNLLKLFPSYQLFADQKDLSYLNEDFNIPAGSAKIKVLISNLGQPSHYKWVGFLPSDRLRMEQFFKRCHNDNCLKKIGNFIGYLETSLSFSKYYLKEYDYCNWTSYIEGDMLELFLQRILAKIK